MRQYLRLVSLLLVMMVSLFLLSSPSSNVERRRIDDVAPPSSSSSSMFVHAKEKLPPWAYYNRTIYPAIHRYDGPKGRPQLSIGIISDVQYGEREEEGRRHYKLSPAKLQHAVSEMNANRTHLDLVMHLGDLVDSDMAKYGPPMLKILKELKYPIAQLLGNHDYLNTPEDKLDDIPRMLGMPARYYSMAAGANKRYRLLVLDGNDLSLYATKAGSPRRKAAEKMFANLKKLRAKNARAFNGGIGDEQLLWMKRQLGEACRTGQRAVIFIHHPMRPKGEPTNLWNDHVLVNTVTSFHCLAAVINGHAHKFLYDFHHTKYRQVHFVTYGGMVQSPFTSFGFADFYEDELHIHGLIFGRQIEYHLSMALHAKPAAASSDDDGSDNSDENKLGVIRSPTLVSPMLLNAQETNRAMRMMLQPQKHGDHDDVVLTSLPAVGGVGNNNVLLLDDDNASSFSSMWWSITTLLVVVLLIAFMWTTRRWRR